MPATLGVKTNLLEFVKEITGWAREDVPRQQVAIQKRLVIRLHRKFTQRTPVDTGHLQKNWQTTLGTPATNIRRTQPLGPVAAMAALKPFGVVWISNNVPYLEVLEYGGYVPKDPINSPQANRRRASRRSSKSKNAAKRIDAKARGKHFWRGDAGIPLVRGGFSLRAPQGIFHISIAEMQITSGVVDVL